jgi:hypothetical protein
LMVCTNFNLSQTIRGVRQGGQTEKFLSSNFFFENSENFFF